MSAQYWDWYNKIYCNYHSKSIEDLLYQQQSKTLRLKALPISNVFNLKRLIILASNLASARVNEQTISDLFVRGPNAVVPGSKMPLQKIPDAKNRTALINFLKTL